MRVLIVSHTLPFSLRFEESTSKQQGNASNTPIIEQIPLQAKPISKSFLNEPNQERAHRARRSSVSNFQSFITVPRDGRFPEDNWSLSETFMHISAAAASNIPEGCERLHVGWPGQLIDGEGKSIDYTNLPESSLNCIERLYSESQQCVPVFLDTKAAAGHYNYCRNTLWPIMHYVIWENPEQSVQMKPDWLDYVRVNEEFAEKVLQVYRSGDLIWILDHHLLLLPGILRKRLQSTPIGLYIRIPVPSSELFRCLPQANELISGMLGANLIGVQAYAYARHFSSCCTRLLGLESSLLQVDCEGEPVSISVIPMGVDIDVLQKIVQSAAVQDKVCRFSNLFQNVKVLLGIDGLDSAEGLRHKLAGYERFLQENPSWVGKAVLIQIIWPEMEIVPTKPSTETLKVPLNLSKLLEFVAKINGDFGNLEYSPVSIHHQNIDLTEYYALLQIADCFISTKERDSLSLIPLEFVVCQEFGSLKKQSPVILSEFTALAGSLSTAHLVNPWDKKSVSAAIKSSLEAAQEEKDRCHEAALDYARAYTKGAWSHGFMKDLIYCRKTIDSYAPTPYLNFSKVKEQYKASRSNYFFLDYDGTLTPIVKTPSAAAPAYSTVESLRKLALNPNNHVFIVSGRDRATLRQWLGGIAGLGFSAEHGCFLKMPESDEWIDLIADHDESWRAEILQVFEYFSDRTPGSFVERKTASITWHYRQCDPEFGFWQAKQCQCLLESTISGKLPVEIIAGKKNLEVRPISVNKGQTLRKVLSEGHERIQAGFIFCAGDDRTDEDMFRALSELKGIQNSTQLITCAIGAAEKKTLAKFHVNNSEQLVNLLLQLEEQ